MDELIEHPYVAQLVSDMGQLTVAAGTSQLLPFDPSRLALILSLSAGVPNATLYLRSANAKGLSLVAGVASVFEFLWQKHGPIVWESVWCVNTGTPFVMGFATLVKR